MHTVDGASFPLPNKLHTLSSKRKRILNILWIAKSIFTSAIMIQKQIQIHGASISLPALQVAYFDLWEKVYPFMWMAEQLKNIASVQNCPDVTILNYLFGLFLFSFFFLSLSLFVWTSIWSNVWRVLSVKSHYLCHNSKVALTQWVTKVRYRAARAAKYRYKYK